MRPFTGKTVIVKDDNIERALRKFKKKITESGLLRELQGREFYEKPTSVRKRKKSAAKNRWRKQLQSQMLPKRQY